MNWQKPARFAMGLFGLSVVAAVYMAIGERQAAAPVAPVERKDPGAMVEVLGAVLQRFTGVPKDFQVEAGNNVTYQDGSTRWWDHVRVRVPNRGGRDLEITANEASAGPDQKLLTFKGAVVLRTSDGLELRTEEATYTFDGGLARVPGTATFSRQRMTGSGAGLTYDHLHDVLAVASDAVITLTDEAGEPTTDFEAGTATLDRAQNILTLDGGVFVSRFDQTVESARAVARLSEREDAVTFLELREEASVAGGGGSLDVMRARDIDLDYTDDGVRLERVVMDGSATVAIKGAAGATGRELAGNHLDLTLDPDGSLTKAVGSGGVALTLPPGGGAPARRVSARTLDATGVPGRGLTDARFDTTVVYREGTTQAPGREVRARALALALDGSAVGGAVFTGGVSFAGDGLNAGAASVRYDPVRGTLVLTETDGGGGPRVSDARVEIEASASIDVAIDTRRMTARGTVRTTLRAARFPSLLLADQPVRVTAGGLRYDGDTQYAEFTGQVVLSQGQTSLRGGTIAMDEGSGRLTATGGARSDLVLGTEVVQGQADEIRVEDRTRTISYVSASPRRSRVRRPQADLQAGRIEVHLDPRAGGLARLEAAPAVSITREGRLVTGDRLTYDAAGGRYDVFGTPAVPVTLVETTSGSGATARCRQVGGASLTFSESADTIVVERRTTLKSDGPCPQALSR